MLKRTCSVIESEEAFGSDSGSQRSAAKRVRSANTAAAKNGVEKLSIFK